MPKLGSRYSLCSARGARTSRALTTSLMHFMIGNLSTSHVLLRPLASLLPAYACQGSTECRSSRAQESIVAYKHKPSKYICRQRACLTQPRQCSRACMPSDRRRRPPPRSYRRRRSKSVKQSARSARRQAVAARRLLSLSRVTARLLTPTPPPPPSSYFGRRVSGGSARRVSASGGGGGNAGGLLALRHFTLHYRAIQSLVLKKRPLKTRGPT